MSGGAMSIGRYFTDMLDPSMSWNDVAEMVRALAHVPPAGPDGGVGSNAGDGGAE